MEFKEVMEARHSVRNFKHDEIPVSVLEDIVRLAAKTPSWENNQPWNVYIATGETLAEIKRIWSDKYAKGEKGTPDMFAGHRTDYPERSQNNMASFMADCEEATQDPGLASFLKKNEALFNAPAIAYLTIGQKRTEWPVYDLGAFGMALMLAAKDLGVDSIPAYECVKFPAELRRVIGIPEDEAVAMGIALGYAQEDDTLNGYRSPRLPLDEILTIAD